MKFNFGKSSEKRLNGVDQDLVKVARKALYYGIMDFSVVQGIRTIEEQEKLYAQGRTQPGHIVTWTMKSKHLEGNAIDIAPYINGRIDWNGPDNFNILSALMFRAAMELSSQIKWGGFWTVKDRPHFEIITGD